MTSIYKKEHKEKFWKNPIKNTNFFWITVAAALWGLLGCAHNNLIDGLAHSQLLNAALLRFLIASVVMLVYLLITKKLCGLYSAIMIFKDKEQLFFTVLLSISLACFLFIFNIDENPVAFTLPLAMFSFGSIIHECIKKKRSCKKSALELLMFGIAIIFSICFSNSLIETFALSIIFAICYFFSYKKIKVENYNAHQLTLFFIINVLVCCCADVVSNLFGYNLIDYGLIKATFTCNFGEKAFGLFMLGIVSTLLPYSMIPYFKRNDPNFTYHFAVGSSFEPVVGIAMAMVFSNVNLKYLFLLIPIVIVILIKMFTLPQNTQ